MTSQNHDMGLKKFISPIALFWIFYTIAAAIVCFKNYQTIVELFSSGELLPTIKQEDITVIDYVCYYVGGILGQAGLQHTVHIYSPEVQLDIITSLTKPWIPSNSFYCPYPPYFFLLMAPFVKLGLTNSYALFCWLGVVANLASIYMIFRRLGWVQMLIGGIFIMCSSPMCQSFLLGNTSIFMLPAVTLYSLVWESKRPVAMGLSMIPYWFKYQYAPIQMLPALQQSPVKFGVTAAASLAVMVVCSGAALGFHNLKEFFPLAMPQAYLLKVTEFENIRGQLSFLPNADMWTAAPMSTLRFAIGFLLSAWFFFFEAPKLMKKHPGLELARPCFSLSIFVSALASPYTYAHDYTMVLLPCLWVWLWAQKYKQRLGKLLFSLLAFLTVGFPILSWAFMAFEPVLLLLHIKAYAIWCEVLTTILVLAIYRLSLSDNG